MGTIELDRISKELTIHSNIILYGSMATEELAQHCADEIETMWNEPKGTVKIKGEVYAVAFVIKGYLFSKLTPEDIFSNVNPKNNYFRVESFVEGNISFVDAIGSNTGYFLVENLYKGSTTVAHEYGHTIGLDHPHHIDKRGKGVPGIMYPRGTWVDAHYQYEADKMAGEKGGTLYPIHRRVHQKDIDALKLEQFNFSNPELFIGAFSSIYQEAH